jgi:hypothetical protein
VLGLIDMQSQGSARPYWRLIWPSEWSGTAVAPQGPSPANSVTLFGADTPGDLRAATQAYSQTGQCAQAAAGNQPILCRFFSGRTVVVPEIPISLHNSQTWVPVGTTLRHLVARAARPAMGQLAGTPPAFNASLQRWCQEAYSTPAAQYVPTPVDLDKTALAMVGAGGSHNSTCRC